MLEPSPEQPGAHFVYRSPDGLFINREYVIRGFAEPTFPGIALEPQTLVDRDQRIIGSNYGGVRPAVDIPRLVDQYMDGKILLDPLISGRRSLEDAEACLQELATGGVLRQLLIP